MRFYLISDNEDTLVGMRLAGIEGTMVANETDALKELNKAMKRVEDTAVVLITQNVVDMIPETVYNLKMNCKRPLIVEVPDRNGNGRTKDAITRYVREAVGIKIQFLFFSFGRLKGGGTGVNNGFKYGEIEWFLLCH